MDAVSSPAVQLVATNTSHQSQHEVTGSVTQSRGKKNSPQNDLESQPGRDTDTENQIPIAVDFEDAGIPSPLDDFPEGGLQAWLVLLGSFLCLYASFGFMVSIGNIQEYLQTNQLSTTRHATLVGSRRYSSTSR